MGKFIEIIEKGLIITRLVTLALTGVCVYMWIMGLPLDETLKNSWLIILGFWFNSEISGKIIATMSQ
jgi:hypothetical protein